MKIVEKIKAIKVNKIGRAKLTPRNLLNGIEIRLSKENELLINELRSASNPIDKIIERIIEIIITAVL